MRKNKSLPKLLMLVVSAMVWCGMNLHAQPVITTQPASQTNLPGTSVSFSVAVSGTGPFTYQWQFNGANFPNNIITTVAGNGGATFAGDRGAATSASLHLPYGLAFDASGNLFIADESNNRIRKVDTYGIITSIAGKGNATFSGDGGAATNASLNLPYGVEFDASGNLFIADRSNNRIRKVATNGIITTVAGGGSGGDGGAATNAGLSTPSGVTFDASGNLFIAASGNNRIRKVATNGIITTVAGGGSGGDGGAATNASLSGPSGVAFDASSNLFIADTYNNRIRKVDTNGIITTVAGNGNATFAGDGGAATNASLSGPSGVTFDAFGNLFIADYSNNRIRKVDTNGIIITVAGKSGGSYTGDGGAATNASLNHPYGVGFDVSGNLFIADTFNNRIRKVLLYAGYPTFTLPNVNVTDAGNYTVVISSPSGSITSAVATLTVAAPAIIAKQPTSQIVAVGSSPAFSVAVAGSGPFGYEWYIAATNLVQSGTNSTLTLPNVSTNNTGNYTVVITNNYGSVTSQVARLTVALPPSMTTQPTSLTNLSGGTVSFSVAVTGIGPFTYQWQFNGTNFQNNIITTVAGNGGYGYSGDGGAATNARLYDPPCITFNVSGDMFIADWQNNRIRKVNTNGIITTVAGNGSSGNSGDGGVATNASLQYPTGLAFDAFGNLFIADQGNNSIRKVDTNGIITTVVGNLNYPQNVGFDAVGNLYIAGYSDNVVHRVDTNGIITTVIANLNHPTGVTFDASGNMYISDCWNNRILKVNTNGIITTVAGNGSSGYSGDGGAAINASLHEPYGVAFDAVGDMFIPDWINNRIRKVDTNGIITTVAGGGTNGLGDGGAATNASLDEPQGVAFDASGNLYIADWLNSRIREVHYAGYPTFALTNMSGTNAGNYTVVITSPYGSVTSSVATLTVIVPPQIIASGTNFGFTTNFSNQSGFGFNLNGTSNQTIVVDGSTNLLDWTPLYTNLANGIPAYFFDPASTNFPGRFYRLRLQ